MNKIGQGQTKILLAILTVLVGIGGFQVWKYQQAQYEKFVASQKRACQNDLYSAAQKVKANLRLDIIYHVENSSGSLVKFKESPKRPGINTNSQFAIRNSQLWNLDCVWVLRFGSVAGF